LASTPIRRRGAKKYSFTREYPYPLRANRPKQPGVISNADGPARRGQEAKSLPTEFTKANFFALISAVVLMGIIGSLSWLQFTSSREAEKLIRHTHEVITTADHLSIAIRDAESNQRDFLLTGDEQFLVPYRDDTVRVVLLQGELRRLTADNPDQQDRLRALTSVIQQKLEVLAQTVHLRQAVGLDAALANVRTGVRQRLMDQIRTSLAEVQREEDLLLAQRRASAVSVEDYTRWIALSAGAVAIGLLALSVRLLTGARAQIVASESEQRSLAEHMRATFDSISQGVGVFGPDYRLVRWNGCFPTVLNLAEPMPRQGTPYQAIVARITTQAGGKGPILETEDQIRHGARGRVNRLFTSARAAVTTVASRSAVPPCPMAALC
jgi:CHASE3 domain sensor protein